MRYHNNSRSQRRLLNIDGTMHVKGYWYFITIEKCQKKSYVSKEDLDEILREVKLRNPTVITSRYVYETGTIYQQLHLHCVGYSPARITYKNNTLFKGFRVYWKIITNMNGLSQYLHKQVQNKYQQDQLFAENYYNNHYGFI